MITKETIQWVASNVIELMNALIAQHDGHFQLKPQYLTHACYYTTRYSKSQVNL